MTSCARLIVNKLFVKSYVLIQKALEKCTSNIVDVEHLRFAVTVEFRLKGEPFPPFQMN